MFTIAFLIVLAFLAIVATVLTETEKFGWATLLLIVSVSVAQFFHIFNFWTYVTTHGLATLYWVLGYLGVGIVWSFGKWFFFLKAFQEKFRYFKERFIANQGSSMPLVFNGNIPETSMKAFAAYMAQQSIYESRFEGMTSLRVPRAVKNKARIVSWMSLWPCSFIGTLLNDPVRRIFNFLFSDFRSLYQKMAEAVFAKDIELK